MRPETVHSSGKAKVITESKAAVGKAVVKGIAASPGVAVGRVRICLTPEEAKAKMVRATYWLRG